MKPTTTTVEELKFLVASRLDVTEFLDLVGWTMFDLVEYIDPSILEANFEELMEACE